MLKPASLAVKFLLELAAFAGLAYWGPVPGAAREPSRWLSLRRRRLPAPARVPLGLAVFGLAVFGLAVGGLAAAGATTLAIIFGAVVIVLLTVCQQWQE